jgi:hypothetical protein
MTVTEAIARWSDSCEVEDGARDGKILPRNQRPLASALRHYPTADVTTVGTVEGDWVRILVTPRDVPPVPEVPEVLADEKEGIPYQAAIPGIPGRKAGKPFHLVVR